MTVVLHWDKKSCEPLSGNGLLGQQTHLSLNLAEGPFEERLSRYIKLYTSLPVLSGLRPLGLQHILRPGADVAYGGLAEDGNASGARDPAPTPCGISTGALLA